MICMMLYDLVINKPYVYPYIYICRYIRYIPYLLSIPLFLKDMSFFHSYVEGKHKRYMFMFIHMGMGSYNSYLMDEHPSAETFVAAVSVTL